MLLILPVLPVQLIAFDLVRRCRLNGVIGESNQIKLRPVAFVSGLGLRLSRILLLVLGLLLRWSAALHLTFLRRVALLITIILLWRGCRVRAPTVSIRIIVVSIGIVRVPVSRVAVVVGVAPESKIETRPVVWIAAVVAAAESTSVSTTVTTDAAAAETARRSATETAAAAETTAYATAVTTGEPAAAGPASTTARVTAAMSSTTALPIGSSNQTRGAQSGEERDL